MVPLLSRAPLAQNELVIRSSGVTVSVSRFQSAPQAEWLLICSGSLEARSKNTTRVGDTTMDSRATIPDLVCFKLNDQPGAEGAAVERVATRGTSENRDHFMASD